MTLASYSSLSKYSVCIILLWGGGGGHVGGMGQVDGGGVGGQSSQGGQVGGGDVGGQVVGCGGGAVVGQD